MYDAAIEVHSEGLGYLLGTEGLDQAQVVELVCAAEKRAGRLWIPLYTDGIKDPRGDSAPPAQDMLMLGELVTALIGLGWERGWRVALAGTLENHGILSDRFRVSATAGAQCRLDVTLRERRREIARGTPETLLQRLRRTGRAHLSVIE